MKYMKAIIMAGVLFGAFSAPDVAFAAPKSWAELVNSLVDIINSGIATLIAAAFAIYFYGTATNILKFEDKPEIRKAYFFWGVIVLFVMLSVGGILNLAKTVLFDSRTTGTPIPTRSETIPTRGSGLRTTEERLSPVQDRTPTISNPFFR